MDANLIVIFVSFFPLFFLVYQIFGKNEQLKGLFHRIAYVIMILYVGYFAVYVLMNIYWA